MLQSGTHDDSSWFVKDLFLVEPQYPEVMSSLDQVQREIYAQGKNRFGVFSAIGFISFSSVDGISVHDLDSAISQIKHCEYPIL